MLGLFDSSSSTWNSNSASQLPIQNARQQQISVFKKKYFLVVMGGYSTAFLYVILKPPALPKYQWLGSMCDKLTLLVPLHLRSAIKTHFHSPLILAGAIGTWSTAINLFPTCHILITFLFDYKRDLLLFHWGREHLLRNDLAGACWLFEVIKPILAQCQEKKLILCFTLAHLLAVCFSSLTQNEGIKQ